ncbi:hypothetical protein IVB30_39010 [Bradyrhizobium sp. 200]|uniref:hypothetical protein n=1 Tax=Bradyrhizobium sp. 200 TaxID=2782665 RepID=UPI001FFF95D6|nr:hypothetical protein [Bradyrhizobium sp. 200]UPJ48925.1 hypothetical protein IVB30_39010 [Bradyrhizobium sp. 200]
MTRTALFAGKDGSLSAVWRFASIVVSFLLVWPPICGIVGWWMKFDFGPPLLAWMVAIVIYSYAVCAPSALLAGIVHAVAAISFRHNSILVPLAVAAGATILIPAQIGVLAPGPAPDLINVPAESYVVFLVASLVASLICWRLTRRFARVA